MQIREFVLEIREKHLGTGHHDTITAKANLSISLLKLRQYQRAIKLRVEIFELYRSVFQFQHAVTLKAYCDLGQIEAELNPLKGYAIQREALLEWDCRYGKDDPYSAERTDLMAKMAASLEILMRKSPTLEVFPLFPFLPTGARIWDEAVELRKSIYDSKKAKLGNDDPEVLYAKSLLADCYMAGGRSIEAYEQREGLLERWRATMDKGHDLATDIRYLAALRAWARNCDRLAAFWAPMGQGISRSVALSATQSLAKDNEGDIAAKALSPDGSSSDARESRSSDARSNYGAKHIALRSEYVRKAQKAWRELLELHLGACDDEWSYEILRTKRDLADSLLQYAGETADESIEQLEEANKLWEEAWSVLARPDRLGPDHPEVLALGGRLRKLAPSKRAMIESWIELVVEPSKIGVPIN